VCDDPHHGHGAADGEWAQIQGLYRVLASLRKEFPALLITNLGGGSQRSDFGMARFTHRMCPADVVCPTAVNRKYSHGIGFILPVGYSGDCVAECPDERTGEMLLDTTGRIPREELEWRCLNAMGGALTVLFRMRHLDAEAREVLTKAIAYFKRIRRTLWGDRYVLAEPKPFMEYEDRLAGHREAGIWEAYQHFSPEGDQVSLFAYRCMSPESERTFVLHGLDPSGSYVVESYRGAHQGVQTGAALMREGVRVRLDRTRKADILLFTRRDAPGPLTKK
jgi:alpha-galactosidase